ncbi:MAG: type I-B CRISPR-associated protein Cas7/Cst2/DevR, partial [Acidimicrobiia bacterium]
IDCPASALNNAGQEPGGRADNVVRVKKIQTAQGTFPYVSAQAFRYWWRTTLERMPGWNASPIVREQKVAYTNAEPTAYDDDDLFGYMRAASKKAGARSEDLDVGIPATRDLTRPSPLRVGTLVSLGPVRIVDDFGTMARHEGDPVPHEHEFYRATLAAPFSLDLVAAGTFFVSNRVGLRNLDDERIARARAAGATEVTVRGQPALRLPAETRARRVSALLRALGELQGGAKLTLHYTDVAPSVVVAALVAGGNHPFLRWFRAGVRGEPEVVPQAVEQTLEVFGTELASPVRVGWQAGYLDAEREKLQAILPSAQFSHPREALNSLADELANPEHPVWQQV